MIKLHQYINRLTNITGWIALGFLSFMMFGITLDVVLRTLTGKPVPGLFEMSEMSMVMVVFMGLGWAQSDDAHIRVTMLTDKFNPTWQRLSTTLAWLLAALALLMLAYPATLEAIYSFSIREFRWGYFQVPIWWAKIAVAIGLWLAVVQTLLHALLVLTGRDPHRQLPAVTASQLL
ncbi:TRAP transporter small permease [Paenochrobactrum pullorum]|uniref:TRAP transporter small permease n=1 Tax=Paenochrobactrum pullorum TaxID=1324351 RepID=UPI0035BBCAF3